MRKGHWSDRLGAIDTDVAALEEKIKTPAGAAGSTQNPAQAIRAATGQPKRISVPCNHTPPSSFHPGEPLSLKLQVSATHDSPSVVHLYYRHVDQGERWLSKEMQKSGDGYSTEIPGDYTNSAFALQYYFEMQREEAAWLYPAFNPTLSNQPYYAISKRSGA